MNFKFDYRTGTIVPKENKQIYFAQSQSGGLLIDDQINNKRYIIERNGNVTYLFGNNILNCYDYRNAHIIANRVTRMFGIKHTYSNFKTFIKR